MANPFDFQRWGEPRAMLLFFTHLYVTARGIEGVDGKCCGEDTLQRACFRVSWDAAMTYRLFLNVKMAVPTQRKRLRRVHDILNTHESG